MNMNKQTLYIISTIVTGCIVITMIILNLNLLFVEPEIVAVPTTPIHTVEARSQSNTRTIEVKQLTRIETYKEELQETAPYMVLSDEDIYMISQILYLEGRGESLECQQAIVSTIINRMKTKDQSAKEVIFAANQFSTADNIQDGHPSDDMIQLVRDVVTDGPTIPVWVTYFRAGHYHEWKNKYGEVCPYDKIDNTYFSYDVKLKEEIEDKLEDE